MPNPNEQPDHGTTLLSWTIPEFEKVERPIGWYFLATLAGIAMIVWALWTRNYLFAIIILMIGVIFYRQTVRDPQMLHFGITEDGLEIGHRNFYAFKDIASFWIVYEPPDVKRVFFTFKSNVRPYLAVPLENENPLAVRTELGRHIPEDREHEGEPTTEALGRLLKL